VQRCRTEQKARALDGGGSAAKFQSALRTAIGAATISWLGMDTLTVITSLVSSGALSLGAARWLTTHLVDHRLAKDLANHKAALDERLATSKSQLDHQLAVANAQLEATLRKGVEEYLSDKAAERQYRLEARKRLYAAIGPLRFQLVVACSDFGWSR
jgi:hypothetical protein